MFALLEKIMSRGIPDRAVAERAARATLAVLGERLTEDEASALASRLPEELGSVVQRSEYDSDFDAAEFYERVRRRERGTPGGAREHADIVLRAVGESLDDAVRSRLLRALPDALGQRLVATAPGEPPAYPEAKHAPRLSTLASGRPGSHHPLSEASPPRGHTHSVVCNDNPHGDTKLSSSEGLTQERLRESLSTGKPPQPDRPIYEASDD